MGGRAYFKSAALVEDSDQSVRRRTFDPVNDEDFGHPFHLLQFQTELVFQRIRQ